VQRYLDIGWIRIERLPPDHPVTHRSRLTTHLTATADAVNIYYHISNPVSVQRKHDDLRHDRGAVQVSNPLQPRAARRMPRLPLYGLVLAGLIVGVTIGLASPSIAVQLKPLGDVFVKLLKMLVTPIVFLTVSLGIGRMADLRRASRIGCKALIYFEVVSTIALLLGLAMANALRPGAGMNIDPSSLDVRAVSSYVSAESSASNFLLRVIPSSVRTALTGGDLLQTLFVAILFGIALGRLGDSAAPIVRALETLSKIFFRILDLIMRLAPIGVLGAIAYTVGTHGSMTLIALARVMSVFYLTCAVFIFGILGAIARLLGFRVTTLIWYLRRELLTGLGTASSESVLAPLMQRMEALGCSRGLVGLVVPAGYSFNMDGGSIYLTIAVVFLAHALNVPLSFGDQLAILAVALVTSKGSSGVSGSGFIILASTLSVVPSIPVAAMVLLLGIDRFMSEMRVFTNLVGNAVAVIAIARWEKELDVTKLNDALRSSNVRNV
jgi:aerobic C4-dicarboxylate transport protein